MICDDTQLNLTRAVDEVIRLREERNRLRNLLAMGLGYVEGFSKAADLQSADDWKEQTLKELGLE
jgi:hypothetical protein